MKRYSSAVFVLAFVLASLHSLSSQVQGQWASTGTMQSVRELHAQAPLPGGKVLSIGGIDNSGNPLASSEVYSSGKWTLTGSMAEARYMFPAIVVGGGKILVSGGLGTSSSVLAGAELYDPKTGIWSSTASLSVPRLNHTATLLPSGKVLVTGGCTTSACGGYTAVSELYDPKSNSWSTTGSLNTARYSQTAVLLKTGKVLVVGGSTGSALTSCEIYDPSTGKWTNVANTIDPRYLNSTNLLSDGKVLAAGGGLTGGAELYPTNTAEIYDPSANIWTQTGNMTTGRYSHTSTLLSDGSVLVAGGIGQPLSSGFIPTPKVDVYNEAKGQFSATTSLSRALAYHAASLLPTGRALTDGGITTTTYCCVAVNNAQIYTPLTLTLSASSLNFGILQIGLTSSTQTITVTNVSSHSVNFTSITGTGDFHVSNTCSPTLNAGQNCTITVSFEPTAVGTRKGVVTLKDNSPGNPTQTIALTGIGATNAITPLPGSLIFPSTLPGTTSLPLSITLYNDGTAPVNNIALGMSPADGTFTQSNNCLSTLNPNSSCVVQVFFTPPGSGTFSATLVVTDSDSSSPQTASLSGVGKD